MDGSCKSATITDRSRKPKSSFEVRVDYGNGDSDGDGNDVKNDNDEEKEEEMGGSGHGAMTQNSRENVYSNCLTPLCNFDDQREESGSSNDCALETSASDCVTDPILGLDIGPQPGMLWKKKTVIGKKTMLPRTGDAVTISYTIKDGSNILEDRMQENSRPLKFTLGHGQMIKAFDIGISTMTIGEVASFTFSPLYAQGIANNSNLLQATVRLEAIERKGDFKAFDSRDERIQQCLQLKVLTARFVKNKRYLHAIAVYEHCIRLIQADIGDKDTSSLMSTLFTNIAICQSHLNDSTAVLKACNMAIKYNDKNIKAWYHLALIELESEKLQDATTSVQTAIELEPNNKALQKLQQRIQRQMRKELHNDKQMCRRMFTSST